MIKIVEFIAWKQPDVYKLLITWESDRLYQMQVSRVLNRIRFNAWKQMMQERPMPGRGGLLPGEKAV